MSDEPETKPSDPPVASAPEPQVESKDPSPAKEPAKALAARHPMRIVDDIIFAFEEGMFSLFLVAMTVLIFLDVIYRQLVSPASKLGALIISLGGVEDEGTQETINGTVAPILSALIGLLIIWGAWASAERRRGKPLFPFPGSALVASFLTGAVLVALGWAMVNLDSWIVFLSVTLLSGGGICWGIFRDKNPGWPARLGVVGAITAGLALLISSDVFPSGYIWSQELSMMLTLWVGFFGASVCVHEGKHIRMEALEKTQPEVAKKFLRAAGHLLSASFCALLTYLGYIYIAGREGRPGALEIGGALELTGLPDWIMTVALPLAFGVTALRYVGSAISALVGGDYGAPAAAEGMAEAEKLARERGDTGPVIDPATEAAAKKRRNIIFAVVLVVAILLPFVLGKGGVLVSIILVCALLGEPLFVLMGIIVFACFWLWSDIIPIDVTVIERMRTIADSRALLAIPLFVMSGGVMAKGEISKRLIEFARALVGWMPGGIPISAVIACMIFAAISGSSPATVIAIGSLMAPAIIKGGYSERFSHGLVTSAGSLGILIPPSIPMIVYSIVNPANIRIEELFASGFGPGLIIGGILMGYSVFRGIVDKTPRDTFSFPKLWEATRDGIWALCFPAFILGGIYSGFFTAVESACASVVYAVIVEVWIHRALKLSEIPKIFSEVGVMLGSFLVIMVIALSFTEFLDDQQLPQRMAEWLIALDLSQWQFLLILNLLLLVVGMFMDIMSAIFVFVPLLAPMAAALGIDPMHLGIVFIVNLEIGYLTPPVGLNLFVASTLFGKPLGHMVRSVTPFIGLMFLGLMLITYVPELSVGFGRWIVGADAPEPRPVGGGDGELGGGAGEGPDADTFVPSCDPPEDLDCDGNVTMQEMMDYADIMERQRERIEAWEPSCDPPEDLDCDGNVTMQEMMEYGDRVAAREALADEEEEAPEEDAPDDEAHDVEAPEAPLDEAPLDEGALDEPAE